MASVYLVFNRRNKLNKKKEAPIELCVTIKNTPNYIGLKQHIIPKLWDNKKKEVKANHPNWFEINTILESKVKLVNEYFINCDLKNITPNINEVKILLGKKATIKNNMFIAFCRNEVSRRNDISNLTIHHHLTKLDTIEEWAGGDFSFDKITLSFIEDFDLHLEKIRKVKKNTRAKYHALIKSYIRRAINKKIIKFDENPYNSYKIRKEESHRERLTSTELSAIEDVDISEFEHLEAIKDKFLFSCYTGLRFSDYQNIEISNFNFTNKGEVYLTFKMLKVETTINRMPIHKLFSGKAIPIIKKYASNLYSSGKLFPHHSEGYFNRSLKKIATEAKINKTITSHIGRHTFGSLLAEKTNDPMLIKTLMGHKKIETSMIYIKLSNKGIEDKLSQIKW